MQNKYIEWLEKEASALGVLGSGVKSLGSDILNAGKHVAKAPFKYLGKTIGQATGHDLRRAVNQTAFDGAATPKMLQGFTANKKGISKLKKTLQSLKHLDSTQKQDILHHASGLTRNARDAKVKLGIIGAGGLYGAKKLSDRISENRQQPQYIDPYQY